MRSAPDNDDSTFGHFTACGAQQANDEEVLALQICLMEHVLGTRIALEMPAVQKDPLAAMESCAGVIDNLRRPPAAPPPLLPVRVGRESCSGACYQRRPRRSVTVTYTTGIVDTPPLFPDRVAIVASHAELGASVLHAVLSGNTLVRNDVAVYTDLEAAALDDASVILFCSSPDNTFDWGSTELPLCTPDGVSRRGFVVIGETNTHTRSAIFKHMHGWVEQARRLLAASCACCCCCVVPPPTTHHPSLLRLNERNKQLMTWR